MYDYIDIIIYIYTMQKLYMAMDMSTFLDDLPIEPPIFSVGWPGEIAEDPALDNLQVELMDAQRAESNRGCDLGKRPSLSMWMCLQCIEYFCIYIYIYDYVCIWYKNDNSKIVITCICT